MKRAFVFPGQGSQKVGMGCDIIENEIAKNIFDRANELLGYDLTEIMFNGPKEKLRLTVNAQPAIFTHSYALYKILEDGLSLDLRPTMVAGHSLGEYTALTVAGAFTFEEALMLIQARAGAMEYASTLNKGEMVAVIGLSDEMVEQFCAEVVAEMPKICADKLNRTKRAGGKMTKEKEEKVQVSNYNCPGQVVISGTGRAIKEFMEKGRLAGAKVMRHIDVSGAFHSTMMIPAETILLKNFCNAPIRPCKIPVLGNVDAKLLTSVEDVRLELSRQITAPVRWTQAVRKMIDLGASEFVEVGSANVLQGLIRNISKDVKVSGISDLASLRAFLEE